MKITTLAVSFVTIVLFAPVLMAEDEKPQDKPAEALKIDMKDDPLEFIAESQRSAKQPVMTYKELLHFLQYHLGHLHIKNNPGEIKMRYGADGLPVYFDPDALAELRGAIQTDAITVITNNIKDPTKPTARQLAETGTVNVDDVRWQVLNTRKTPSEKKADETATGDPGAGTNGEPSGPKQVVQKVQREDFWFVRHSSSLLDNDLAVSKDETGKSKVDLANTNGALLSYDHDYSSRGDKWTAQGSVTWGNRYTGIDAPIQELWILPGIDFAHLDGTGVATKSHLDSLSANLGTMFRLDGTGPQLANIKIGPKVESDFGFHSLIGGGVLEYEPVDDRIGLGTWSYPDPAASDNLLKFKPRLFGYVDGGSVFNKGKKRDINTGDVYSRFGPKVALDIGSERPVLNNFNIELSYAHYLGILGSAATDYKFALDWKLDQEKVFSLQTSYEHGGLDANGDKVNTFTIGLTITQ
jgi:hypothetical protein